MTDNSLPAQAAYLPGRLGAPAHERVHGGWRGAAAALGALLVGLTMLLAAPAALADEKAKYEETLQLFRNAGESANFFKNSYGYAVFPTIGKGGFIVGGSYGTGRVFRQGEYIGDTTVTKVTAGFQLGGQAFSQIIFFEDERALKNFTSGNFEFGADASAVVITAGATGTAGTTGTAVGASGGDKNATTAGKYVNGMAVFTIIKGGAMLEAAIGGQKFTYKARGG